MGLYDVWMKPCVCMMSEVTVEEACALLIKHSGPFLGGLTSITTDLVSLYGERNFPHLLHLSSYCKQDIVCTEYIY